MKFVVSSTDLLSHLSAISKVISSKSTMPILDNFLFLLSETELTITASDLESTLITSMELDNTEGEGTIAVPAKLLIDTLKEFP
ncbi:MAG TPA: DNA polymerase III subunit beta, partial [Tangfeifania sp.]|nr:DNA polymerase III subunit beta [Tangfeifania sp.]